MKLCLKVLGVLFIFNYYYVTSRYYLAIGNIIRFQVFEY